MESTAFRPWKLLSLLLRDLAAFPGLHRLWGSLGMSPVSVSLTYPVTVSYRSRWASLNQHGHRDGTRKSNVPRPLITKIRFVVFPILTSDLPGHQISMSVYGHRAQVPHSRASAGRCPDLFGASFLGPVDLASFIYEGNGLDAFCNHFSGEFCGWLLRRSEYPDLLSWAVYGRAQPLKTTRHFASDSVSLLRVLPLAGDGV